MSDYRGIATVTAALHEIVQGAINDAVPGVHVRIGPPRAVKAGDREANLYLYQITPSAQLRNADLPRWHSDGRLLRTPQAALNLHYIISFAGEEHLVTERMLGKVISVLHASPLIDRALLRKLASPNGSFPFLAGSDLDRQHDTIQIIPEIHDFETLAKLWTVFFQIAHRPSLTYIASPVMVDGPHHATVNAHHAQGHGR